MMRLLVCGGRNFNSYAIVASVLDSALAFDPDLQICNGGARGADSLATRWAQQHEIPHAIYPAQWKLHGKAAGFLRNQRMLDDWKPTVVVAFPGGNGTRDMLTRARRAGIAYYEIS